MNSLSNHINICKLELNKVIFPIKEQVRNALISVVVVVSFVSIYLAIVDFIFSLTISKVL